ncbi:MAG TPA: TIGR02466 family protein [Pyrinomonadaceae bacterium]|jgi:uncharacterized protein (TIGR02466 family)
MLDSSELEFTEIFPSPLIKYLWPESDELNKELARLILSKEKDDGGVLTTNVGGWHSKKNFQNWDAECVHIILERMMVLGREMLKRVLGTSDSDLLEGWTIQAWANINRYGHYNKFHTHVRNLNLWSGVYYVNTGVKENDDVQYAHIIFADQHRVEPRGREDFKKRHSIRPESGLMLLFPSSLGHRVEPHYGTDERITVAFNLKNTKFTTINYEIESKNAAKVKPA